MDVLFIFNSALHDSFIRVPPGDKTPGYCIAFTFIENTVGDSFI